MHPATPPDKKGEHRMSASLLLVGCGKMGGAMLAGWKAAGAAGSVVVVEPFGAPKGLPSDVLVVKEATEIPSDFAPDAVILAVKPQMMDQALPFYARYAGSALFLSIAAVSLRGRPGRTSGPLCGLPAAGLHARLLHLRGQHTEARSGFRRRDAVIGGEKMKRGDGQLVCGEPIAHEPLA